MHNRIIRFGERENTVKNFKLSLTALITLFAFSSFAAESSTEQQGKHRGPPPEVREAMKACAEENGISIDRSSGQKPTEEERAIISECLESKGFSAPKGPPPQRSNSSSSSSTSKSGGVQ